MRGAVTLVVHGTSIRRVIARSMWAGW